MFFQILLNNIAPIFALVIVGFFVGKKFSLDVYTLSKINFYVFIPAMIFTKIYEAEINVDLLIVVLFTVSYAILQLIISSFVSKALKIEKTKSSAFKNVVTFYNTGNFGLPLITLIFLPTAYAEYAIMAQITILVTQNLCTFTIGMYNASNTPMELKSILKLISKLPIVGTIVLALVLRTIPYDFGSSFIWPAFIYARQGMIPVALLSLGINLSIFKVNLRDYDVYIASFMRLCLGPVISFCLISIFNVQGVLAQVLFISTAVPTAINTALIAVELNNQPEFATRVVVLTTILSSITLPIVIFLARHVLF